MENRYQHFLSADLTGHIVTAAVNVHRELGPGLLENAYRTCLVHELLSAGHHVETEVPVPIEYRAIRLDVGYRADLIVDSEVMVELKAVERLLPIHEAQLLTYLKLRKLRVGLLLNFNSTSIRHGIRRLAR